MRVVDAVPAILALAACAGSTGGTSSGGTSGGASSSSTSGGTTGGGGCGAGTSGTLGGSGGTLSSSCGTHTSPIATDLTLDNSCGAWHVHGSVLVESASGSPFLTLQAGGHLQFDLGARLGIGLNHSGGILARGSSGGTIIFTSAQTPPGPGDWTNVTLGAFTAAGSEISNATISGGGGSTDPAQPATLIVDGECNDVHPTIHDVTLSSNGRIGLLFVGPKSGFGPGASNVTIHDWDGTSQNGLPPLSIDPNQAGTIPASLLFGESGPIELRCRYESTQGTPCLVDHSQTWPLPPINDTYLVPQHVAIGAPPPSTDSVTLTASSPSSAAPLFLLFSPGAGLDVNSSITNGKGNLVLLAVHLSEAVSVAAPGWDGITFIVPSGGMSGSSLTNCEIDSAGTVGEGAHTAEVFVDGRGSSPPPSGPTITGTHFDGYADCGIFWDHISNGDSYAANDFGGLQNGVCHP